METLLMFIYESLQGYRNHYIFFVWKNSQSKTGSGSLLCLAIANMTFPLPLEFFFFFLQSNDQSNLCWLRLNETLGWQTVKTFDGLIISTGSWSAASSWCTWICTFKEQTLVTDCWQKKIPLCKHSWCPLGWPQLVTHDELLTRAAMSSWLGSVTLWIGTDRQQQTNWHPDPDTLECKEGDLQRLYCSLFQNRLCLWMSESLSSTEARSLFFPFHSASFAFT